MAGLGYFEMQLETPRIHNVGHFGYEHLGGLPLRGRELHLLNLGKPAKA